MIISSIGPGETSIKNVRTESENLNLASQTYLTIRLSLNGPASLTDLSVNGISLLDGVIQANNGWLITPINTALSVNDYLRFTVQTGFNIPSLGAFLSNNQKLKYLSNKKNIKAGEIWNAEIKLYPIHLG